MSDYCEPFRGKKITMLGLGLLGRGVGDAEFLAGCGAELVVTDKKSEAELAESVAQLKHFSAIKFHLGGHRAEDFVGRDLVIKAAGVPLDSPEIAIARASGVSIAMSTALFAKYAREAGATIVGITGTRGKSTVTQMIYETLKRVGKDVLLGGNVRGASTLAMLPQQVSHGTIAVLELDSWQLQGFGDLKLSPDVAVFTNFMPDHQNYYKDMDEYFADKANIFRYQNAGDTLVVGRDVLNRVEAARPQAAPHVVESLPTDWHLAVIGQHNRENAALAAAALRALGLSEEEIKNGLESFQAVEGRLQFLREVSGVKIYNDNNATTPEATVAALNALDSEGKQNVILIMGGADKGLDMSGMRQAVHAHCKDVLFLAGTGTERIKNDAPEKPVFDSLRAALNAALSAASQGDIILFSPAFASFGMFKNEYDRGDQFAALVSAL